MNSKTKIKNRLHSIAVWARNLVQKYTNWREGKWQQKLLATILSEVDSKDASIYKVVLGNALHSAAIQVSYGGRSTLGTTNRQQVQMLMNLSKRVIDKVLVMKHIIGIQPMQGPVGLVYFLQYRTEGEPLPETTVTPFNQRLTLDIVSQAVEAGSRKLQAAFSIEAAQDLREFHGLDMEAEISNILSEEIASEIIREIVRDLIKMAETTPVTIIKAVDKNFIIELNRASNEIARLTRRGCGQVLLTNPLGLSLLRNCSDINFVANNVDEKILDAPTSTLYAGDILYPGSTKPGSNPFFKVLVTVDYSSDPFFLVGYKGTSGECDVGYTYSPYVPVMTTGVMVNPATFQPVIGLMTRYGKSIQGKYCGSNEKSPNSLTTGESYYKLIRVKKAETTEVVG